MAVPVVVPVAKVEVAQLAYDLLFLQQPLELLFYFSSSSQIDSKSQ